MGESGKKKPGGKSSGKKCIPRHESHHKYASASYLESSIRYYELLDVRGVSPIIGYRVKLKYKYDAFNVALLRISYAGTTRYDTKYEMLN